MMKDIEFALFIQNVQIIINLALNKNIVKLPYKISLFRIKNNKIVSDLVVNIYESEIIDLGYDEQDRLKLLKEISENVKDCVIKDIQPYMENDESFQKWSEILNSDEEKRKYTIYLYNVILKNVEGVISDSIKYNLLDSQEFLNFMDKLNELSIDPDRTN